MHTMKRYDDAEWMVGVVERGEHVDEFTPLFAGASILTAIRLTSVLNGGGPVELISISSNTLESLARRADEMKERRNGHS